MPAVKFVACLNFDRKSSFCKRINSCFDSTLDDGVNFSMGKILQHHDFSDRFRGSVTYCVIAVVRNPPKIERAYCFLDVDAFHGVGVVHDGFQIAVTEQLLNRANIDVRLQEMAGKTVVKGVSRGPLAEGGLSHRLLDRLLHHGFM
jgi:hypothetical protein